MILVNEELDGNATFRCNKWYHHHHQEKISRQFNGEIFSVCKHCKLYCRNCKIQYSIQSRHCCSMKLISQVWRNSCWNWKDKYCTFKPWKQLLNRLALFLPSCFPNNTPIKTISVSCHSTMKQRAYDVEKLKNKFETTAIFSLFTFHFVNATKKSLCNLSLCYSISPFLYQWPK